MEVGIPELDVGLVHPPSLVDEETVDDACSVIGPSSFLGRLDDRLGYDPTVRTRDLFHFELAWDTLLDQMPESERNLGHVRRGNGRLDRLMRIGWQDLEPKGQPSGSADCYNWSM